MKFKALFLILILSISPRLFASDSTHTSHKKNMKMKRKSLNPEAKARLTVPVIPFSKIDEMGAGMYKGESIKRDTKATTSDQLVGGGAIPTITLHSPYAASKKTHEA